MSDLDAKTYVSLATNYVLGPDNIRQILAQVTAVDYRGQTLVCFFYLQRFNVSSNHLMALAISPIQLDVYVAPTGPVSDFRTQFHGLDERHLCVAEAKSFMSTKATVAELIRSKILVGHALWGSLALLGLTHPAVNTRDVAAYTPFRRALGYSLDSCAAFPSMKDLMHVLMRREIQPLFFNTTENARAAMDLFRAHRGAWEGTLLTSGWPCTILPAYWNVYFT